VDLELTRQQWEVGNRRVESLRGDPERYGALVAQLDLIVAELRKRVGQAFTLDELARTYATADAWVLDTIDRADPEGPPPREAAAVADAAFHRYAVGATDYRP
jgi:hypothetical protein